MSLAIVVESSDSAPFLTAKDLIHVLKVGSHTLILASFPPVMKPSEEADKKIKIRMTTAIINANNGIHERTT